MRCSVQIFILYELALRGLKFFRFFIIFFVLYSIGLTDSFSNSSKFGNNSIKNQQISPSKNNY